MGSFYYDVLMIITMLFDFLDLFVVNVERRDSFFNGTNLYEFHVRSLFLYPYIYIGLNA